MSERSKQSTALRIRLPQRQLNDIRVVVRPVASAQALLMDAIGQSGAGAPATVVAALRGRVRSEAVAAYRPTSLRGATFYPDVVLPELSTLAHWSGSLAESIADADPDAVTTQLLEHYDGAVPSRWTPALAGPRRWLEGMAGAVTDASPVLDSLIGRGGARLEIERERVSEMLDLSGPGALLNSISSQVSFVDGELRVAYGSDISIDLRGKLVLVPMLAGPRSFMLYDVGDDLYLGYPVRGALTGVLQPGGRPREDRLVAVLGAARAKALRDLDRPKTMGGLARDLDCAPSTATYHCHGLADAGLINVIRMGRTTWVARTSDGEALVALLSR